MLCRFLLLLLLPLAGVCQNTIGLPDVVNYYKNTYSAGLQNWDIKQDKNGIIYIANNEGLLSFDGKYWKLYPLPHKTIVRSVEIGADNRIYAGGQDEFGYFAPDHNGNLQYHSLVDMIPEKDRSFADVWDIVAYHHDIFFRTSRRVFRLSRQTISVFFAPSEWSFLGICKDKIYAHDIKKGLFTLENAIWSPYPVSGTLLDNVEVTSILPIGKDTTVLTTLKNGVFLLSKSGVTSIHSPYTLLLEKSRIYGATALNNKWIAVATTYSGVSIIDVKGQLIQSFSKKEGLQHNNVLSIFLDKQRNLWLGMDNGLDCILYNSAIKHLQPESDDGAGYSALIHNQKLYIGTTNGLYSTTLDQNNDLSFTKGDFKPVANASGQVWGLAEINGKLLVAHHEGAMEVDDESARKFFKTNGVWNFLPLSGVFPSETMIAGNYRGLAFFNYRNNDFTFSGNLPNFTETSRFVTIDAQDNIWVSHPYHGVYKISKGTDGHYHTKLYSDKNGLPSLLNNHVYKIRNEMLVATEKGIYHYNAATDRFEPVDYYQKLLGNQSIRYLKEDTEGNIWFIHEKTLGVLDVTGKSPEIIYLPELNTKMMSGFEFIYAVNENNIFMGGERGFYLINYQKYKKNLPELKIQIRTVRIIDNKDSLFFGGYFTNVNEKQIQDANQIPSIANHWKTIHFEFSSPLYGEQNNLEYSYRLKGFNDTWSDWNKKTEKEYTNLFPGSYTLECKVRNNLGNESMPASYSFRILPPWYQTIWAYLFYLILTGAAVFKLYQWQGNKLHLQKERYEQEQRELQYLHSLEIDKAENELVMLRNEKLQSEINHKNSELATSTMHLVQKGELFTKVKNELSHILKVLENDKGSADIKKMIKLLSEDEKMDKDWEHFAQHFDKVHSDFVVSLKEAHPNLSPNETKLCAYLRMNLSSKEMAQLMNISVRGVEISRYRLRKKLNLSTETSLFSYLISLTGSGTEPETKNAGT